MAQGTRDMDRYWIRKILFGEERIDEAQVNWCDVALDILEMPVPERDEPKTVKGTINNG